jgi:hypothetical protein
MQGFWKAVKVEFDTRYLSWGSSPKLASGSLLLVGIKPSPMVVGPPLLLELLLLLLQVADPLACVWLPVLGWLDVLAQRLVDVGGAHVQLAHLLSQSGEASGRSCTSWGSARAGTGGPVPWGLLRPLGGAGTLPWRTSSLIWMRLRLMQHEFLPSGPASCNLARKTRNTMPAALLLLNKRDG